MGFILMGLAFIFGIPEDKDIVLECSIMFYNYSCRKVERKEKRKKRKRKKKREHSIRCSGVMLRPILNRVNPKGGGGGEKRKKEKKGGGGGGGEEEIVLLAS